MELIEIDENLFILIELMLKFSKMFRGDFKRQIMKQPWTQKPKVPFLNQTSCQQQEEQQRNTFTWLSASRW